MIFGGPRAHFGLENPNLAGALLAMLIVGVWYAAALAPRKTFLAPLGMAVLVLPLALTASRGAIVALFWGLATAWIVARCPLPRPVTAVSLTAAAMLFVAAFLFTRMGERVGNSRLSDASISVRTEVYAAVPAMVAAAPAGWGRGNATDAFHNWFQDPGASQRFKNLLSTHGTWLVEMGWVGRFAYVFAWAAALALCVPLRKAGLRSDSALAVSAGILLCFAVACCFSHIGSRPLLWVLPMVAVGIALVARMVRGEWSISSTVAFPAGAAALLCFGLWIFGSQQTAVRFKNGVVRYGKEEERPLWFVAPNTHVLGEHPGKIVRAFESAVLSESWPDDRESKGVLVILSAEVPAPASKFLSEREIIWINPPAKRPDADILAALRQARSVAVVWGSLRTDGKRRAVEEAVRELPNAQWIDFPGHGLFASAEMIAMAFAR